jgi:hypothetical protein
VVFWTAANNDGFASGNVYRRIISAATTTLVSKDLAGTAQGAQQSAPSLSADGSIVVFQASSGAGVYVPDAPGGTEKVFLVTP